MNRQRLFFLGVLLFNAGFCIDGALVSDKKAISETTEKSIDWKNFSCLRTISSSEIANSEVFISPKGDIFATNAYDKGVKLWNVEGELVGKSIPGSNDFTSIAFSPDGKLAIADFKKSTVALWDVQTGKSLKEILVTDDKPNSMAFSPNGKMLAVGGLAAGMVGLWDVQTGACISVLKKDSGTVSAVVFFSKGDRLVAYSGNIITLWDIKAKKCIKTTKGIWGSISSIAVSSDENSLSVGCSNGTVVLLNMAKESQIWKKKHDKSTCLMAFSLDGKMLAAAFKKEVGLIDVKTGELMSTLKGHEAPISSVVITSGQTLITGSHDGVVKIWGIGVPESASSIGGSENPNNLPITNVTSSVPIVSKIVSPALPWYKRRTKLFGATAVAVAAVVAYSYRGSLESLWGRITSLFRQPAARC